MGERRKRHVREKGIQKIIQEPEILIGLNPQFFELLDSGDKIILMEIRHISASKTST